MIEIRRYFYLMACASSLTWIACGTESNTQDEGVMTTEVVAEDTGEEEGKIVYYGTPSLVEVASIMKSSGANFSNEVLNNPANKVNYTTQVSKALNVGVYGADLTYSAMFDETQESINYLKTIKLMAEDLGMMGAFESDLLANIESNITNRDSLLDVITDFYWSADAYLMDNERTEVASLIVTGGWVESMYIACHMAANSPKNKEIKQRIAEQKLILKNLILFLKGADHKDAGIDKVLVALGELKAIYDKVQITQTVAPNKTDVKKNETIIEGETEIVMSESQLAELTAKISEIRTSFVK